MKNSSEKWQVAEFDEWTSLVRAPCRLFCRVLAELHYEIHFYNIFQILKKYVPYRLSCFKNIHFFQKFIAHSILVLRKKKSLFLKRSRDKEFGEINLKIENHFESIEKYFFLFFKSPK